MTVTEGKPWKRLGLKKRPKASRMDHVWGILNADGDLWTYHVFDTREQARAHLVSFWHGFDGSEPRKGYRIVPVKVTTSVDYSSGLWRMCDPRATD